MSGAEGGATVFEVLPGAADTVRLDSITAPGVGTGFAAEVLGAAVASSGALLVARSEPLPTPASLIQFRRPTPGSAPVTTSWRASAPVGITEGWQRFSADGDRAVLASLASYAQGHFVVLDFFGVDASGDWFLEDTVRSAPVVSGYHYFDVVLRGDEATLRVAGPHGPLLAYERAGAAGWRRIDLPQSLSTDSLIDGILADGTLVTTHDSGLGARLEVHDRNAGGGWSPRQVIPLVEAPGTTFAWRRAQISRLPSGDQLISVQGAPRPSQGPIESRVFRRAGAAVRQQATVLGSLSRLTPEFAVVELDAFVYRVIDTGDLTGTVRACESRGMATCVRQRAGDLHYLYRSSTIPPFMGEFLLTSAPPGSLAILIGSTAAIPSAGTLDSLCVGTGGLVVRAPSVAQVQPDGVTSWALSPLSLPLMGGGTISGLGQSFVFQAIVRSPAGPATSRAIVATL